MTDPVAGDQNLRLLLRMICLRRTRVLLDIPNSKDQTIVLSFLPEERNLYSQIIDDTARKIDDCISSRSITKAYGGIFEVILRLRLLCNNGTLQSPIMKPEIETCCTEDGVVERAILACSICSCEINVSDGQDGDSPGASPQNPIELLCPACLFPNKIDNAWNREKLKKQLSVEGRPFQETYTTGNGSLQQLSRDRASPARLRSDLLLNGCSSKLSALISNIQEHTADNKRYAGCPPRLTKN